MIRPPLHLAAAFAACLAFGTVAAPPPQAVPVQAWGARNATCQRWGDACVICQRGGDGAARCSTPGIACVAGPVACVAQ